MQTACLSGRRTGIFQSVILFYRGSFPFILLLTYMFIRQLRNRDVVIF